MFFLFRSRDQKELLKAEMRDVLAPTLQSLGFKFTSNNMRHSFPITWFRDNTHQIDVVQFQWDKYGRPRFVINFRPFESQDDLVICRERPNSINAEEFGFRAYMEDNREPRWFAPDWLIGMVNPRAEFRRVVRICRDRIREIDGFFKGGAPSSYMRDSATWYDKRPSVLSTLAYHPPHRRVGR